MAILSGIPVIHCRSIETTLKFYQQLLQFVIVNKRDVDGVLDWVHLMHGDTTLMLQSTSCEPEAGTSLVNPLVNSNVTLYYFVNNIDDLHHFIKAKNNDVSTIKQTDYHMREFSIADPDGNLITIGMSERL
jgi:catechol 2,3-dioxygenase-like lactoylglutathione lyase family enzyme